MPPHDNAPAIEKLRVLQDLPQEVRSTVADILATLAVPRSVPAGARWIREHDSGANKGYILLKGTALIQKSGAPDAECRAPELLGEMMQFMPSHERTATVTATSDSVVLRFLWDDFWRAVDAVLQPDDAGKVKEAVKDLAWLHFVQ